MANSFAVKLEINLVQPDFSTMLNPIQKLLTGFVILAALWFQQMGGPLLVQANSSVWDHDGHHHAMSVVGTGDSVVVTLSHLPEAGEAHDHGILDDDDDEEDVEQVPVVGGLGFSAQHGHPDHVLAFSASKFSPWHPNGVVFKACCWAEIPCLAKEEAPPTSIGVFLGTGMAARLPPWSQYAFKCVLRATVMLV